MVLVSYRKKLYKNNLHDSYQLVSETSIPRDCWDPVVGNYTKIVCSKDKTKARTIDGTCNDLKDTAMGSVFYRLGRNLPLENATTDPNILWPNPRKISEILMKRNKIIPAKTLNLLSVGWLQFMVHDWFAHGPNDKHHHILVPVSKSDPLGEVHSHLWKVRKTRLDPCAKQKEEGNFHAFQNLVTHWWDGSQIYGSDKETNDKVRLFKDGKLKLAENGLLPFDHKTKIEITGFNDNWWTGLSLMHNLFTKEHNAICDMLKTKYKTWNDDQLYDTARLINSALMAKIHTIEWTPVFMNDKIGRKAMYGQWYGIFGKDFKTIYGSTGDAVKSGIPGTVKYTAGVPFSMTEEFVAAYRMHPLLPDFIDIYNVGEETPKYRLDLKDMLFGKSSELLKTNGFDDLLYTFGIVNPGTLSLNNYPNSLRNIKLPTGEHIDLAAVDILRDRERGLPRYNKFRQLLGKRPVTSFYEITQDEVLANKLMEVYGNDVGMVDLLVGTLAENPRPPNWGFGDTVFREFIVMASRRLMADRFYTDNYNAEYYTKEGMAWVEQTNMKTVMLRHYPRLKSVLTRVGNPFFPWNEQAEWKL